MTPILPIGLPATIERPGAATRAVGPETTTSFASTLAEAVDQARDGERAASDAAARFAAADPPERDSV
jgi:hypothetical protein